MLIPIGKEQTEVRRWPWVSAIILALNFLAMGLSVTAKSPEETGQQQSFERLRRIRQYLLEHPYVEVPAELPQLAGDGEFVFARSKASVDYPEKYLAPSPEELKRQTAELARLVAGSTEPPAAEPSLWQRWGFLPAERRPLTVLTSMFLHVGWLHFLGNMLMLYLTAPFVEDVFGRALFTVLYLGSGVVALVAHCAQFPDSSIPLVGASGSIAGVMGSFMIRFGGERLRFLFVPVLLLPTWHYTFHLRAAVFLGLWATQQLLFALLAPQPGGVAFWAHVGGFAFGVVFALGMKVVGVEKRWIHPAIEKETSIVAHPSLEQAREARQKGNFASARRDVRKVLAAEPDNLDAWSEAYDIAVGAGDMVEAARRANGLLGLYVRQGETQLAWSLVQDVIDKKVPGLPQSFWAAAAGIAEKYDRRWSLESYRRAVEVAPDTPGAMKALFRQAQILRSLGDVPEAREAFERTRTHPSCSDGIRQAVDRALAEMARGRPKA